MLLPQKSLRAWPTTAVRDPSLQSPIPTFQLSLSLRPDHVRKIPAGNVFHQRQSRNRYVGGVLRLGDGNGLDLNRPNRKRGGRLIERQTRALIRKRQSSRCCRVVAQGSLVYCQLRATQLVLRWCPRPKFTGHLLPRQTDHVASGLRGQIADDRGFNVDAGFHETNYALTNCPVYIPKLQRDLSAENLIEHDPLLFFLFLLLISCLFTYLTRFLSRPIRRLWWRSGRRTSAQAGRCGL